MDIFAFFLDVLFGPSNDEIYRFGILHQNTRGPSKKFIEHKILFILTYNHMWDFDGFYQISSFSFSSFSTFNEHPSVLSRVCLLASKVASVPIHLPISEDEKGRKCRNKRYSINYNFHKQIMLRWNISPEKRMWNKLLSIIHYACQLNVWLTI